MILHDIRPEHRPRLALIRIERRIEEEGGVAEGDVVGIEVEDLFVGGEDHGFCFDLWLRWWVGWCGIYDLGGGRGE